MLFTFFLLRRQEEMDFEKLMSDTFHDVPSCFSGILKHIMPFTCTTDVTGMALKGIAYYETCGNFRSRRSAEFWDPGDAL